jgi:hypothetical protein
MNAKGTFDVKTTPLSADDDLPAAISRFALLKQFQGDLQAESKGQMLGAGDLVKGTAGYVAIEHIVGTLHGRGGSFVLQHLGTMDHDKMHLTVSVVPGSGADQLAGISGTMTIAITEGKHSYDFEYDLPAAE